MPASFKKALLVAGLAAALVGCGGGSSDTAMTDGSGSMNEETTALDGTYATANDLVGKLSADSTPAQFKEAKDARTALLNQLLAAGDDVSPEKRTELNGKLTTLENAIMAAEKARDEKVAAAAALAKEEADKKEAERIAGLLPSAWYKSVKDHTPVNPGTFAPDDVLVGTETNVTGLPEGWSGTNYEYEEGATNEQGKTFMKTVTRMTPEIELTWENLAREAANPENRNEDSVINKFLGGANIQIQAIESGVEPADTDQYEINWIAADTLLGGSVKVFSRSGVGNLGLKTNETAANNNIPAANTFPDHTTITTQFRREDFSPVGPNDLVGVNNVFATTANRQWFNLDKSKRLVTESPDIASFPIKWKDIDGILSFKTNVSGDLPLELRFNDEGFLEVAFDFTDSARTAANDDYLVISFVPTDSKYETLVTQNIHTMPLKVRSESSKSSTTELAYWASTMKDNTKVTLKTWAEGMDFDPVTTAPEMLTGSATYNGLAAGYYAVGTESNGEFTADTMLTANFKTEMVSGMIKGFEAVTGGADLSEWSLTLNSADFIDNKKADVMDDDVFQTFTGRTVSNGGMLGHWKGEFLGMANPGTDLESAADMTNDYPEAVVGNFTGHFDNKGHVAGAFGVELHDDNKE